MKIPVQDLLTKWSDSGPEIGIRVLDGKIIETWEGDEASVAGELFEIERKLSQSGIISAHTHPYDKILNHECQASAQDILACAYRGQEIIVGRDNIMILKAKRLLEISLISLIEETAWEESGGSYWTWKRLLAERLPFTVEMKGGKNE